MMNAPSIVPGEFAALWSKNKDVPIKLIDVRSPAEFRACHISFAHNIPITELNSSAIASRFGTTGPLYIICQSGVRSQQARERLVRDGIANAISIDGGMQACHETELPVEIGQKTISLERQVRITAGLLILIGGVLAYFVHPYAIGLSMFIGAGLVFAGISNTCGMGMVLARMPWNR